MLGGGGIVPDVRVPNRVAAKEDKALQTALGAKVPKFRDAMVDALALKASKSITSPISSSRRRCATSSIGMQGRGASVDRAVYDSASALVSRVLAAQITRFVFGTQEEFTRGLREDATLAKARALLQGADKPSDLLRRAGK